MNFPHDWTTPYPSKRAPLCSRNVVATSQPLAAQAGLRMMLKGGNAVDAALATAICLTVVEPVSNGIGSDLFALIWADGKLHGLNASGRAPTAWTPDYFRRIGGMPERGWNSVTVPGCVLAWRDLSKRFGKLPFADLFEPAIDYAQGGHAIGATVAHQWAKAVPLLRTQPGYSEHFMPRGRAPEANEWMTMPAHAASLRKIAESNGDAFYKGELAERMVAHSKAHGGALAMADLASHTLDWVEPISVNYRGYDVCEIPPNGQGIAALIALGILRHTPVADLPVDSVERWHWQIEAMKLAHADVNAQVADPRYMTVSPQEMLNDAYLATRAKLIDPRRAQDFGPGDIPKGGTIYLSTADQNGMMVSLIQSNYMGFGSGVVVDGISLQNRGMGFVHTHGHPNEVGPGKRPFQTIIPGFVMKDGKPLMANGVMGGAMQPQGHVQTLMQMIDWQRSPQAALDAPRWRVGPGMALDLEAAADSPLREALSSMGHPLIANTDNYFDFGCGQIILKTDSGYVTGADPRKDSLAVGF